jgi:phage terminase small subunit
VAKGLTAKQEKFVQELLKGKSQRKAYRAAYDAKNMSDAAVDVAACRLLKSSKVALKYDQLRAKVANRAEEKAIITVEEIIKGIVDIARDDIGNYLSFRTEKTVVGQDPESGNPIFGYAPVIDLKDSRTIDTKNIKEVSLGRNGFKFKLNDKDKAWYKLADIMGVDKIAQAKQKLAEDRFEHEKDIDAKKYW